MKLYLLLNTAIWVDNLWFLPFQQYEFVEEVSVALVEHRTRSGHKLIPKGAVHPHYRILRDGNTHDIPQECGVLTNVLIPEEWVNRNRLWYEKGSDNIRDYIKAAQEYLNIEIRYRPESAHWYRKQFEKKPEVKKTGGQKPKISEDYVTKDQDIQNR